MVFAFAAHTLFANFVSVQRLWIHIMLALFLLDTTPLYQVLKSTQLVQHYIEHRAINNEVGFIEYLAMHYWGQDANDSDDEKDMQLPFKRFEVQSAMFLFIPTSKILIGTSLPWPLQTGYGMEKQQFYFNPALDTLFRPPQA